MYKLTDIKYKNILEINKLHLKKGELTVIAGSSGCGKTTLLRLLNRMLSHDEGLLLYKGKEISETDPVTLRREAVMMPQNPPMEGINISEAIKVAFIYSDKPYCGDTITAGILRKLGIEKRLDTPLLNLSGGEWQKVALARVILLDSPILLLDEPTSAVDQDGARTIMQYLSTLKGKKTIIIVSHAVELAKEYADSLILIDSGKLG